MYYKYHFNLKIASEISYFDILRHETIDDRVHGRFSDGHSITEPIDLAEWVTLDATG